MLVRCVLTGGVEYPNTNIINSSSSLFPELYRVRFQARLRKLNDEQRLVSKVGAIHSPLPQIHRQSVSLGHCFYLLILFVQLNPVRAPHLVQLQYWR